MKSLDAVVVAYGLMQIAFGFEAMSKSVISVVAGTFIGVLCIVGAVVAKQKPMVGYGMAAVGALLALGQFLPKLLRTPVFYPQGIEVATSVALLIFLAFQYNRSRNSI